MNLKAVSIQIQKPILSPLMQQSVQVLMLPLLDLSQTIDLELQNNPLLEAEIVEIDDLKKRLTHLGSIESLPFIKANDNSDDEETEEIPIPTFIRLEDELLRQLNIEMINHQERAIGEYIIGNIDEDGFLTITVEEIGIYFQINDLEIIENILKKIQQFEPIGIASRDVKECLINQLNSQNHSLKQLSIDIISSYWEDLGYKRYQKISQKLSYTQETIKKAAQHIATLDPKPARNFRPHNNNIYIQPDVVIIKDPHGHFHIEVNHGGLPQLRINPVYKNLLNQPKISEQERNYVREKLTNALNFMKSIQQRGETLLSITKYILEHQKSFFENEESNLVPMLLKDIAEAINRNESTISRAISNKYVDTPRGVYPLRFFFTQQIFTEGVNCHVSPHAIKEEIKQLVEAEDKSTPLSDQEIQNHFELKGLKLARRTLNKYRQALRIPTSSLRKN